MSDFYNINGCMLDKYQIKAIESENDYTLLVAGAGSGKTLTILGKIKYLKEVKHYKDKEILVISFTNETVNSLKNKINNMGYNIDVKTFHKLAMSLITNKYKLLNYDLLDYVIDEYFKSIIYYDKKLRRLLKNYFYYDGNIDKLYNSYEYNMLKKTISTFIHLLKGKGENINNIYEYYKKSIFNERIILKYIMDIYLIYTRELESTNTYDFDDLLIKATEYVNKNIKYKYIIIDEFQDTSLVRFKLIKKIIDCTGSKLFVVGDDYQSIYRFSGCNLDLFINFTKYFNKGKIYYLKYTYRNSNQLIHVSVNFIMKNKKQLRKHIESNKNINKPIKIVFNKSLEEIINIINDKDILVIGRNNSDIENINYDNKLTIHRSKGLEANNVILVNSDNIPSKLKNEKVLRYVLNDKDYIMYEEERRLFYVALTRTKNNIYIMVNKKRSPFIKELLSDYKNYIEIIS